MYWKAETLVNNYEDVGGTGMVHVAEWKEDSGNIARK